MTVQTKLSGIFLENFQSIRAPTFIKLRELTLLYGPNSAGKSTMVDAINLWERKAGRKLDVRELRKWVHDLALV